MSYSRRLFLGMILAAMPAMAVAVSPKELKMKQYTVEKLSFEAPAAGVKVVEAGNHVFNVELADPATPDTAGAWFTFYFPSAEALSAQPDPLAAFKASYLGSAKPAEKQVSRDFFGKSVSGDWQQTKIPKKLVLEAYRVEAAAGLTVMVGLRRQQTFDEAAAEAFFKGVIASLKVSTP